MERTQQFGRAEKLKRRTTIQRLFREGQSVAAFPLRLVFVKVDAGRFPVQFGVSVGKKRFKRAPDRNRLKRQIRESYRRQKHSVWSRLPAGDTYAWMVIYTGSEAVPYAKIRRSMRKLMDRFLRDVQPKPDGTGS